MIPENTDRTPEAISNAMERLLKERRNNADDLLLQLETKAIDKSVSFRKGKGKGSNQFHRADENVDDGAEPDVQEDSERHSWAFAMAQAISKLFVKLQSALLGDSIIKYFVE